MRSATILKHLAALAALSLLLCLPQPASGEESVRFADATLKATVEAALGKTNPTPTDMLALTSLYGYSAGISDLTGLEYAANLQDANLKWNPITDLSPLAGLTALTALRLEGDQVSDISPLAGLTNLAELDLWGNQVSDTSPLAGLTNLAVLSLWANPVSNLSPLAGLTNLTYLVLGANQISDISPLAGLTHLTNLYLADNQISDISPLAGLTNLKELQLQANPLNAEACAVYLPQIRANNPGIDLLYDSCVDRYTLTVSSTAGGSVTDPGTGSSHYNQGTVVPVVAAAESGWHFAGWTGTAVSAGKVANPALQSTTVTVDADYTLQANFAINRHTLTVSSTVGGSVFSPGIGAFEYDHGSVISISAGAQANCHFTGWTGSAVLAGKVANPASLNTTVTVDADYTLQATFAVDQHTLTISSTAGGSVFTPGVGPFQYDHGSAVSISAAAQVDWHFARWTGTAADAGQVANPASASTTVTVDADYTLVANFAADSKYNVMISATPGGTVSSPGIGSFQYGTPASVPIVAAAQAKYHFTGWTGTAVEAGKVADPALASTAVTVDGDYTLQANFEANEHTLTITCDEGGSVTTDVVSPSGSAKTLTGAGSYVLDHGAEVKVTVTAQANWKFTAWSGTMTSGQSTLTFTLFRDERLEAHFAMNPQMLVVSCGEGGTIVRPGVGSFAFERGAAIPVEAAPNPGYRFVRWTGTVVDRKDIGDPLLSQTSVVLNEGGTLEANFEPIRGFHESWETAAAGIYAPAKTVYIHADEGAWSLEDAVSVSGACGSARQRAEILKLDSGQALLLTSADSNNTCSDIVSVSLAEAGLVNPGFGLPVDANTVLSFYEVGQLDHPGVHGSGMDCTVPPCFDNVSLLVSDNKGNMLAYVLQRHSDSIANTFNANFRGSYGEIFLDPTGIYYRRSLLSDLRTIPAFDPAGAQIQSIEFRVDEHGSAILDELTIALGTASETVPVYRFWSPVLESHFFTTGAAEKQMLTDEFSSVWTFEGIAWFTLGDNSSADAAPVYRFWSPVLSSHFYTISEAERDMLLRDFPNIWTLDGIAFYAYPEGRQPANACPVYRFWSAILSSHFYTTSERERDNLVDNFSDVWTLEGVAWYAYPPQWDSGGALGIVRDRHKPELTK